MKIPSSQSPYIDIDSGAEDVWYDVPKDVKEKRLKALEAQGYQPATMAGAKTEGKKFYLLNQMEKEYITVVTLMLGEIAETAAGVELFRKINHNPRRTKVTITMPELSKALTHKESGTSPNQTIAGAGNFYVGLPGSMADLDAKKILVKAGADAVLALGGERPFAQKVNIELRACMQARLRFDARKWDFAENDIVPWYRDGTWSNLGGWQQRYVGYMVTEWLTAGAGSDCCLKFDPWNSLIGASARPPIVGLYHELCHACYYLCGETIFDDITYDTELLAIGISPYETDRLTGAARLCENRYRAERPMPARDYI